MPDEKKGPIAQLFSGLDIATARSIGFVIATAIGGGLWSQHQTERKVEQVETHADARVDTLQYQLRRTRGAMRARVDSLVIAGAERDQTIAAQGREIAQLKREVKRLSGKPKPISNLPVVAPEPVDLDEEFEEDEFVGPPATAKPKSKGRGLRGWLGNLFGGER